MLIHLIERRGRARTAALVDGYLGRDRAERTPTMVAEVRALMDRYGSIDFAVEYAEGIAGSASVAFDEAFAGAGSGEGRDFVQALIPYMLERST